MNSTTTTNTSAPTAITVEQVHELAAEIGRDKGYSQRDRYFQALADLGLNIEISEWQEAGEIVRQMLINKSVGEAAPTPSTEALAQLFIDIAEQGAGPGALFIDIAEQGAGPGAVEDAPETTKTMLAAETAAYAEDAAIYRENLLANLDQRDALIHETQTDLVKAVIALRAEFPGRYRWESLGQGLWKLSVVEVPKVPVKGAQADEIERLAKEFARQLKEELEPEELAEVVQQDPDSSFCLTHDYLDANEVMIGAWDAVIGRELSTASDEDVALWNAAWSLARKESFWVKMGDRVTEWIAAWEAHMGVMQEADAPDAPMHSQALAGRTRRLTSSYKAMHSADARMTRVIYPQGYSA